MTMSESSSPVMAQAEAFSCAWLSMDVMTQAELAALAGVGVRFISDLERGKEAVHFGLALRIARLVGLDCSRWRVRTCRNCSARLCHRAGRRA